MVSARLKKIFGRVAAVASLAATMVFYALGFQIGAAYYQQWQENKADATAVTQTWDHASHQNRTDNLPWAPAGGALALSFGAGAAAIATAKARRNGAAAHLYSGSRSSGYGGYGGYNNNYNSSNDGFFWGYLWGSGGRSGGSSSSSSSNNNGGAAAAVVIVAGVALAASASVVSGIALKNNFSNIPGEDALIASQEKKAEPPAPVVATPAPPPVTLPKPEVSEIGGGKKKGFSL